MKESSYLSLNIPRTLLRSLALKSQAPKRTSAPTYAKLFKDSGGTPVDEKLYRSIIGSLWYFTASRLDISFVVGVCSRYQ